MKLFIKPSPFLVHMFWTTLASLASVLANFFAIRWLTEGLGGEEFGAYSLANRLMSTLAPFASWAMGTALARYVSLSKNEASQYEYLTSAFLISLAPTLAIVCLGVLGREDFVRFIFREIQYKSLFMATLFLLAGYSWFVIVNAFYFGSGKVRTANFWQVAIGIFGSLLVAKIYAPQGHADIIIFLTGALYFTASLPLFFYMSRVFSGDCGIGARMRKTAKELWRYGLPRTTDGVLLAGLLSAGIFLAARLGSLEEAGYLAIGLAFLRIAEIGTGAFSLLVLPKAGKLLSDGSYDFLKSRVEDILVLAFQVGLFCMFQLLLWSRVLVDFWVGPSYVRAVPLIQILILGTGPYLTYVMLRPILDALQEKPINTQNLFFAFITSLFLSLLAGRFWGGAGLALGTTAGLLTLAGLSSFSLFRIYGFDWRTFQGVRAVMINGGLLLIAVLLKDVMMDWLAGVKLIGAALALELLLFVSYLMILRKLNTRWLSELEKRLFSGSIKQPAAGVSHVSR